MKVREIRIHNILGIENLEIRPGEITSIEGKNGEGKTSAIEAIKAVVQGGHDATLLRQGAESGQVVIVLDDGLQITKKITAKESTLTMKHPDFGTMEKPQTRLDKLTDALSVNPIAFLTAPAPKRAEYLLQAMPITLTKEDLAGIYEGSLPGMNGLENLELLHKKFYDERTVVNRQHEEKKGTINQLEATLPPEEKGPDGQPLPTIDWITRGRELLQKVNTKKEEYRTRAQEFAEAHNVIGGQISKAYQNVKDTVAREYADRLQALNDWKAAQLEEARQVFEKTTSDEAKSHDRTQSEALEPLQAEINQLDVDEKAAAQRAKDSQREAVLRQTVAGHRDQLQGLQDQSDGLTTKLEAIKHLRERILANLPIHGVTVKDGQIYREEIPFDRLNTAQQIEIAVAVAKLRARDIGIVCVDGLECLDEQSFLEFESMMRDTGLQVFVTRVTNRPFEIITK